MTGGDGGAAPDASNGHRHSAFTSDNCAGAHPRVLEALIEANRGHTPAYGADPWSERTRALMREQFGPQSQSFLVFNGTAANVLCIRAACGRGGAVICADTAHISVDEGGAPEAMAGAKLFTTATPDGKLTPDDVRRLSTRQGDEHQAQVRLVSISQSTELGTCYQPDEIAALADCAHQLGLSLHLDGARLCHAAAALGVPLRELTREVGVDLLSFGGTKVGLLAAEAVVILEPALAEGFAFLRKQTLQLASKGRFLAAQFEALLSDGLWLELAGHANAMARRLADAVRDLPGVTITRAVEANAVFARIPAAATAALQQRWRFYVWDPPTGEVRWMCSWSTQRRRRGRLRAGRARHGAGCGGGGGRMTPRGGRLTRQRDRRSHDGARATVARGAAVACGAAVVGRPAGQSLAARGRCAWRLAVAIAAVSRARSLCERGA